MKTFEHTTQLSAIKNILILGILILCSVQTSLASDWRSLSSDGAELESIEQQWPIILKIAPGSDNSCAVSGMFLGHYMCSLKGEVWPEGDAIKIKIKGDVSTNTSLVIYGTLSYRDANTVKIDGTLSVNVNGSVQKTPCMFYMEDKSVRVVVSMNVDEVEPWQKAMNRYYSFFTSDKLSEYGKSVKINKIDGESDECELNNWEFIYKIKNGPSGLFTVDERYLLKVNGIKVMANCSKDYSGILFVCGQENNRIVFFVIEDKLYTIEDSRQAAILNQIE